MMMRVVIFPKIIDTFYDILTSKSNKKQRPVLMARAAAEILIGMTISRVCRRVCGIFQRS